MSKIKYSAHCSDLGWLAPVDDLGAAGTVGQSRALEAFRITELDIDGGVDAYACVQDMGWSSGNPVGSDVGSTGLGKYIEAIKIGLTGEAYNTHDIWYRCHVQDLGWLDWSSNGEVNGTTGGGKRVECIQITVAGKDEYFDPRVNTDATFIDLTPRAEVVTPPTDKATELLDKARSWLGYTPEDPMNTVFGQGDYCCHFVRECCQDVGVFFPDPYELGNVPKIQDWANDNNKWVDYPEPACAVIFDFNNNGTGDHIGFVEQVYGQYDIDTIEANTGSPNGVHRVVRQSDILGYIKLI